MAQPVVGIIMGSDSDWDTVAPAAEVLAEFGIPFEVGVVSAHRTPEKMLAYAKEAHTRDLQVIIACAGGAAHLPGMVAAATPLPVIGIPRALDTLDGLDSLLSILGAADPSVQRKMVDYQARMAAEVERKDEALRQRLMGE